MISIVIPTRDRMGDLERCLRGIAAQDAPHLLAEVIVIDDHAAAPCGEGVRRLARQLRLPLAYDENRCAPGSAAARNRGAALAHGDLLGFLDDDAVPAPNWLSVANERMHAASIAAVTGRILPADGHRLYSRARQLRYDLRHREAQGAFVPVSTLAGGNAVVAREAFEAVGGFDPRFGMMHDRELALRLAARGWCCRYAHDLIIRHRNHKGIALAYRNAFQSAYFRLQLEALYPDVSRLTIGGQLETLRTLIGAARPCRERAGPALVACSTELVHTLGYLWYRFADRRPRFERATLRTPASATASTVGRHDVRWSERERQSIRGADGRDL